jgi:hypothetical protein
MFRTKNITHARDPPKSADRRIRQHEIISVDQRLLAVPRFNPPRTTTILKRWLAMTITFTDGEMHGAAAHDKMTDVCLQSLSIKERAPHE